MKKATPAMKKSKKSKKSKKKSKRESKSASKDGKGGASPSRLIDARIKELSDWRGETLARVRSLIKQADPEVGRGMEVERGSGMVARRNHLHRRDVQELS